MNAWSVRKPCKQTTWLLRSTTWCLPNWALAGEGASSSGRRPSVLHSLSPRRRWSRRHQHEHCHKTRPSVMKTTVWGPASNSATVSRHAASASIRECPSLLLSSKQKPELCLARGRSIEEPAYSRCAIATDYARPGGGAHLHAVPQSPSRPLVDYHDITIVIGGRTAPGRCRLFL